MPKAGDERTKRMEEKRAEKRARGSIACAECRRLKLKCDRVVPCASCTRRGCESICPNGQLVHGQGKMLLADTERLHEKIRVMSARIRALEDSLQTLYSRFTRQTHPLLTQELLNVKSTLDIPESLPNARSPSEIPEEMTANTDAFGTLVDRESGAPAFFGTSAGAENYLHDRTTATVGQEQTNGLIRPLRQSTDLPAPPEIPLENAGFDGIQPLPMSDMAPSHRYEMILTKLPPWPHARRLCDIFLCYRTWEFGFVTHEQLNEHLFPLFYPDPALSNGRANFPYSASMVHSLGVMFAVLALGAFVDLSLPPAPNNEEGKRYTRLLRVTTELAPVLDNAPDVNTIQLVVLTAACHVLNGDGEPLGTMWRYIGLANRLGQSIALHLDASRWKLSPKDTEQRRALFYELLMADLWISMATGRMPCLPDREFDVELPAREAILQQDGNIGLDLPLWKARFARDHLSLLAKHLSIRTYKYAEVLELDKQLVDVELPECSRGELPRGSDLIRTMYYFAPMNCRDHARLYLNRRFFAQAITDDPDEPSRGRYGRSFIAACDGARAVIRLHGKQCERFPEEMARLFGSWSNPFCAVIMLASVLLLSPKCEVAQGALEELTQGYNVFKQGAKYGGRAAGLFPTVEKMYHIANRNYEDAQRGAETPSASSDSPRNEAQMMLGMVPTVPNRRSPTHSPPPSTSRFSESDVRSQPPDPARSAQPPISYVTPSLVQPALNLPLSTPLQAPVPIIEYAPPLLLQPPPQTAISNDVDWTMSQADQPLDGFPGDIWHSQMNDAWSTFLQQFEMPPEHEGILSYPTYGAYY